MAGVLKEKELGGGENSSEQYSKEIVEDVGDLLHLPGLFSERLGILERYDPETLGMLSKWSGRRRSRPPSSSSFSHAT